LLISTGEGGPGSVADGKTVGKTGRLSKEALACLGAELWSEEDLENNGMHLNFAYLQHNATALGIHHAPLPKDAERRLVWMINAGITDPQFKANAPPPATSPSGGMNMETAPAEAVELVKKVSAARDALQAAPDDTAAKAALGDLEAQLAEIMLKPAAGTAPGRGLPVHGVTSRIPAPQAAAANAKEPRRRDDASAAPAEGSRGHLSPTADPPHNHGARVRGRDAGERGHDAGRHA